jgi:putative ABC transport system permease protein
MQDLIGNSETVKVVGVLRPVSTANTFTVATIGYDRSMVDWFVGQIDESEIVKEQLANPDIDVFSGLSLFLSFTASVDDNLRELGHADINDPSTISIYCKDFASKDYVTGMIDAYNDRARAAGNDDQVINYTDYIGLLMSSVTTIINGVTYVLIAFVSISLIVSSIMIGIITYISVLERTKEIGVLRSIGASKRDISMVFNAETLIEGFSSGVLGILVTIGLLPIANVLIEHLSDLSDVAQLPVAGAFILIVISMALTLIAGILPSHKASKLDPVIALRTE